MKFLNYIEENKDKKIVIYFDMDGVFAELDIGNFDYDSIRPINSIINLMKKLHDSGITVEVLSVCRNNEIVKEKLVWLKKYVPFIENDKIHLLSKEDNEGFESNELKSNFLNDNMDNDKIIIEVDDDMTIIKKLLKENPKVKVYHISSLMK